MKEGKWIFEGEDRWRCSACEHRFIGFDGIDYTFASMCNYCPNCGALMIDMDNTIINDINDDIEVIMK